MMMVLNFSVPDQFVVIDGEARYVRFTMPPGVITGHLDERGGRFNMRREIAWGRRKNEFAHLIAAWLAHDPDTVFRWDGEAVDAEAELDTRDADSVVPTAGLIVAEAAPSRPVEGAAEAENPIETDAPYGTIPLQHLRDGPQPLSEQAEDQGGVLLRDMSRPEGAEEQKKASGFDPAGADEGEHAVVQQRSPETGAFDTETVRGLRDGESGEASSGLHGPVDGDLDMPPVSPERARSFGAPDPSGIAYPGTMLLPDELGAARNAAIGAVTLKETAIVQSLVRDPNWRNELAHLRSWSVGAKEGALPDMTVPQSQRLDFLESLAGKIAATRDHATMLRDRALDADHNMLQALLSELGEGWP